MERQVICCTQLAIGLWRDIKGGSIPSESDQLTTDIHFAGLLSTGF